MRESIVLCTYVYDVVVKSSRSLSHLLMSSCQISFIVAFFKIFARKPPNILRMMASMRRLQQVRVQQSSVAPERLLRTHSTFSNDGVQVDDDSDDVQWFYVSWSAHYRRRSEGVAKTIASVCCCWRRTVWTWTATLGATVLLQLCIMTLPFNRLTAYNISRDCFQCSLTLSVTCSRCEAL